MHFSNLLLGSLAVIQSAYAAPVAETETATQSGVCKNPVKRYEWRELSKQQQKSYLDAVLCLTKKKAISGITGTVNRFDDHQAVHSVQTPDIHWVGHFILWHRYFVATYEKALRDECNYTGGQPYWNWSLDAEPENPTSTRPYNTSIFDSKYGFGGNGPKVTPTAEQNPLNITGGTGGGCVETGPFAAPNFYVNYPEKVCLTRDFVPWIMNGFADPALVQEVLDQPDYTSFARQIEGVPAFTSMNIHGSGHFGVGGVLGTIGNAAESPGDPLFYLHHGNLDRILWEWQQKNLTQRLNEVGGPVVPFDYSGTNVTLDFTVGLGKLAPNVTLKDLLNTEGGTPLCYTY